MESDIDNDGHAAIFEVKFGKKTKRATEASRERSAEQFCKDQESVLKAATSLYLRTVFELKASCIYDIKKKQLVVTLSRLRCWRVSSPQQVGDEFTLPFENSSE